MRALLTSGIKAILAIAALSTAAHWALRVQRDSPNPTPPVLASAPASLPEPTTTGSIEPRRIDRPAPRAAEAAAPAKAPAAAGLDQTHLAALIAGAVPPKKAAKPAPGPTRTAAADKPAAKR